MTTRTTWRLWQPPGETLEALAEVFTSHWHAAKAPQERLFWPSATNWLHQQAVSLTAGSVFGTRYLASLAKHRETENRESPGASSPLHKGWQAH